MWDGVYNDDYDQYQDNDDDDRVGLYNDDDDHIKDNDDDDNGDHTFNDDDGLYKAKDGADGNGIYNDVDYETDDYGKKGVIKIILITKMKILLWKWRKLWQFVLLLDLFVF